MVCFAKYDNLFYGDLTSNELVFLQPVEYNSYFAGACISWRRDANGDAWQPHDRITDHLGSTRLETNMNGTITAAYDYKPFGEQIPLMTSKTRKTYIGKERDDESYLGDFGVRKYDYAAGRFTSPDVLWEKYMGWSPYNYCGNNPISALDSTGYDIMFIYRAAGTLGIFDPGHISFVVSSSTDNSLEGNSKRPGWSFTTKNDLDLKALSRSGTESRQSLIKSDMVDATKAINIKTNSRFDAILIGLIEARKKENEKYQIITNNCVTTTNELIQRALEIYGSDINIEDKKIYKPSDEIKYFEDNKSKFENSINK